MADLKRVYAAPTEEIALAELDSFDENGAENIRKSRNPGKTTGRISQPISNIRKPSVV